MVEIGDVVEGEWLESTKGIKIAQAGILLRPTSGTTADKLPVSLSFFAYYGRIDNRKT